MKVQDIREFYLCRKVNSAALVSHSSPRTPRLFKGEAGPEK